MKLVILAGGLGTRIAEETHLKPKPMIEIGGKPILWHIMKIYSHYGINEFIICCGYKGYVIKEYFANFFIHNSDVTFYLNQSRNPEIHTNRAEPWKVTLVDTGEFTQTAGRLSRVKEYLDDDEEFCFTYGDGVADINIKNLIKHHKRQKKLITITAVQPPARFGALDFQGNNIKNFIEKPIGDNALINGGFFVVNSKIMNLIQSDSDSWEYDILHNVAKEGQINGFKHKGFWQSMDTLRDRIYLEELWQKDKAPWKLW